MDWTSIAAPLIKLGLTGLGTAFGGPLGGTIGSALGGKIAEALGAAPTPDAVSAALTDGNADVIKAKLADLESARQTELAAYQAQLGDVQNARQMEVSFVHEQSAIAWAPIVVSSLVFAIVLAVVCLVALAKLAADNAVVGWATASGTTVLTYWLGSSSGSRRMGDAVRNIAQTSTAGQALGAAIKRAVT